MALANNITCTNFINHGNTCGCRYTNGRRYILVCPYLWYIDSLCHSSKWLYEFTRAEDFQTYSVKGVCEYHASGRWQQWGQWDILCDTDHLWWCCCAGPKCHNCDHWYVAYVHNCSPLCNCTCESLHNIVSWARALHCTLASLPQEWAFIYKIELIPMARLPKQHHPYSAVYPTCFFRGQACKWQHLVVYWHTKSSWPPLPLWLWWMLSRKMRGTSRVWSLML